MLKIKQPFLALDFMSSAISYYIRNSIDNFSFYSYNTTNKRKEIVMFRKQIDLLKEDIIHSTCELIQIPSVFEESSNPSTPFGKNCNIALEYMLDLGKQLGFRTKNLDGYCRLY